MEPLDGEPIEPELEEWLAIDDQSTNTGRWSVGEHTSALPREIEDDDLDETLGNPDDLLAYPTDFDSIHEPPSEDKPKLLGDKPGLMFRFYARLGQVAHCVVCGAVVDGYGTMSPDEQTFWCKDHSGQQFNYPPLTE